ncbi:Hypothetical protein A7982_08142 [Minicystis rosea]|nr:Hypothetical protein A7982_08142 [Minicystis rosea]
MCDGPTRRQHGHEPPHPGGFSGRETGRHGRAARERGHGRDLGRRRRASPYSAVARGVATSREHRDRGRDHHGCAELRGHHGRQSTPLRGGRRAPARSETANEQNLDRPEALLARGGS